MDNYPIKSVTFGGFDKQDVVRYIEQAARQAAEVQEAQQNEIDTLTAAKATLSEEVASLRKQVSELTAQCSQQKETLEAEVARLETEAEALRADAENYTHFRDSIGAIECEARKRAAELEAATQAQLQRTVDLFRQQYQVLMSTFESTASHVNSELRKVEVNLSQLPRAMDQAGSELNTLAAQLKQNDAQ